MFSPKTCNFFSRICMQVTDKNSSHLKTEHRLLYVFTECSYHCAERTIKKFRKLLKRICRHFDEIYPMAVTVPELSKWLVQTVTNNSFNTTLPFQWLSTIAYLFPWLSPRTSKHGNSPGCADGMFSRCRFSKTMLSSCLHGRQPMEPQPAMRGAPDASRAIAG